VLLLDEPTNGVDPVSRREFWNILYRLLKEKVTIFVSTAYLDEAERFGRLALLHEGRVLAIGTPDEVRRLHSGAILEVRCGDPRRGREILKSRFPEAAVGKALADAGIAVTGIRRIDPGLEDVFVSVLSSREGGVE
jgi:ABC-2 type transport system ATP-binding protein